jgi:hypothetical protein
MTKRLLSHVLIPLVLLLGNQVPLSSQCTGPMSVSVLGAATGLSLTANETHVDPVCSYDNGSVTISATGGTMPYTGTGTFSQPVGTQVYTVVDFNGCMSTVSVTVAATAPRPTGILSGTTTACAGVPVTLMVQVTGTGPFSGTLSDGTTFSGTGPSISVVVTPAFTTNYTLSTLADTNCSSEPGDLSGNAIVGVLTCTYISGKIFWEGSLLTTMAGVNQVIVSLTGDDTDVQATGIPGTYSLFADMGSMFTITPKKNLPMPNALNGVTAADASRVQLHIIGALPFTDPYKMIGADVNKTNSITTADVYAIQQAVLGTPLFVAIFVNNTWRFVPKSLTLPLPPWGFPEKIQLSGTTGAIGGQDFVGIKIGDVNNTANPINTPSAAPELIWKVQDQVLVSEEIISVDFQSLQFDDLLALQFGLQFDTDKLEFIGLETIDGSPLKADNFGLHHLALGEIRAFLAMMATQSMMDGATGFRLKFKALQDGYKLSEALRLTNEVLLSEAYTSDFTPGPVTMVYEGIATTGTINPNLEQFKLLQNRPNPFASSTRIGFLLPESCEAKVRVFDAVGQLIEEKSGSFAKGYHELEFQFEGYAGDGLLYYELVTPFGTRSLKMVLAKK